LNSFYTNDELDLIGFSDYGADVKVSRNTSIYHPERITLGDHVRIDDFCILSACANGFILIGSYVHIAAYCLLEATAGLVMDDFSGLAGRCTIYGGSDNYSGQFLTNPCVPSHTRQITSAKVHLKEHAVVGASSVILPGITIGLGSAVGAMSLVTRSVPDFEIHAGIPAKSIKNRLPNTVELGDKVKGAVI
jgi:galactoside O-acetyltransferase